MSDNQQTPLEKRLINTITNDGPISIEQYMNACLANPEYGYYMGKDPFGRGGDFITAPEISQMFGEAIGVWFATAWQMMGKPETVNLIELGPGRGTLMADIIRASAVLPEFAKAVSIHLVDISPALRQIQGQTFKNTPVDISWHQRFEQVPAGPSLIIANEFFDALPIRQYVLAADGWHERLVGVTDGKLAYTYGSEVLPQSEIPTWAKDAQQGDFIELSPQRDAVAKQIGSFIAKNGGAGLFIDYGHVKSAPGDTFQGVYKHKFIDCLFRPGKIDLTSHVDFEQLANSFEAGGAKAHNLRTQGQFLIAMGLREREAILKKKAPARTRINLGKQADRLVNEKQMGVLFKVLAVTDKSLGTPHPFGDARP